MYFDFDSSSLSLRPDARRVLDEVVAALDAEADLRIQIEGHTSDIGTSAYNQALGVRRASAVEEYLTSRGFNSTRFQTVSYGEERPAHDNSRDETRRLNRRVVVRVQ